jgi:uncharacterized protein YegJ (DUF2314 family)
VKRSLCLLLVAAACKGESGTERSPDVRTAVRSRAPVTEPSPAAQPVPAGSPLADQATIRFGIYFTPRAKGDARAQLVAGLRALRPPLEVVVEGSPRAPSHAVVGEPPIADHRPPDRRMLEHAGRGLSEAEVAAVQDSQQVVTVTLVVERARMHRVHREALEIMLAVASKSGGLLWDEDTRQLFSRDAWRERTERWTGPLPDASSLYTIHSYQDGELVRMVTLGLAKLGLPDLVVEHVAPDSTKSMSALIDLVAQTMVEGAIVRDGGLIEVDSTSVPDKPGGPIHPGARVSLALAVATRDEGDADNRLWEIAFPPGPADRLQERQTALVTQLFGSRDEIMPVDHDEELLELSRRARARLLSDIKKKFQQPAWSEVNHLMVNAPFRADDGGLEWMWMDVLRWKGTTIEGILQNDPAAVSGLRAGARVTAEEDSVFDYTVTGSDGTTEGDTTGELMERRQKEP